jgi:hypothetical protein
MIAEFDRQVGRALNVAIPSFERSVGRTATPSERLAIVTATRKELGEKPGAPAVTAGAAVPVLVMPREPAMVKKYAEMMERALEVAPKVAGRGLTVAEVEDLSANLTAKVEAEASAKPLDKVPVADFRASLAQAVASERPAVPVRAPSPFRRSTRSRGITSLASATTHPATSRSSRVKNSTSAWSRSPGPSASAVNAWIGSSHDVLGRGASRARAR